MKLGSRLLAFLLLAVLAFWFTAANSRELVNVDLFLFRIRASLPLVVFGSMLTGMLAVFLVGLRADLRTQRLLGRYREVIEGREPVGANERGIEQPGANEPGIEPADPGTRGPEPSAAARRAAMSPRTGDRAAHSDHPNLEEGRSDDRARLDA